MNKDREKEREVEYHCAWCGHIFKMDIRTSTGISKHSTASTQIECPKCHNFISTYGEEA